MFSRKTKKVEEKKKKKTNNDRGETVKIIWEKL